MKQVTEMNWTDGAGSALQKLGSALKKAEREQHSDEEDYFSDPRIFIMDLDTGTSCVVQTEPHKGGKTDGHGYRRCKSVRQRIPAKLPTKKVLGRLLKMAIRNFVPKNSSEEEYSRVVEKAVEDIAAELADDSRWSIEDDKFSAAITAAISDILGHTWTERVGDSPTKLEAIPTPMAVMDVSALEALMEKEIEV